MRREQHRNMQSVFLKTPSWFAGPTISQDWVNQIAWNFGWRLVRCIPCAWRSRIFDFRLKKIQKSKTGDFLYEKTQKYFYLFFYINFSKIRLRHAHRNSLGSLHSKFELIWSSQSWDIVGPVFLNYQLQNGISPVFFDQTSSNLFCVLLKSYTLMAWNHV